MHTGLHFLELLPPRHARWFIRAGSERRIPEGTTIIREGEPIEAVFLVADGLFGVYTAASFPDRVATLGPGEIIGEVSFIDEDTPAASVVALDHALVLCIPRERLRRRMERDSAFAASVYRAIAGTISARFRRMSLWQGLGRRASAARDPLNDIIERLARTDFPARLED
jgi:CRP-like cAMP-binding protein